MVGGRWKAGMSDVTQILEAIEGGDGNAAGELVPLVYEELRLLAAQRLSYELPGQTLQATALVHEAYLRLMGDGDTHWRSRGHFFGAAAEAMRRILVESARRKRSLKCGGDRQRIDLDGNLVLGTQEIIAEDLLALNDALEKLSERDKTAAEIIKLRIFGGLTVKQAAAVVGVSASKAYADLDYARAWLHLEMADGNARGTG